MPKLTEEQIQQLTDDYKTIVFAELQLEATKASLTLKSFIDKQLLNGVDPATLKATLINDLKVGGQIFGSYRSAFKQQVIWGVEQSGDRAMTGVTGLTGDAPSDWIAIADSGTCGDCLDRSQQGTQPYSYWVSIGLPSSGNTECTFWCRCDVVPSGKYTDEMKKNAQTRYFQEKYNATHEGDISWKDAQKKVGIINE